ncbi:hypothetical protein [Pedobacter sp.]|uniref:hypothetical protein n=1 Tax=Pedobacter sp. TaxID=1411316 RepID=UPI003C47D4DB
MKQKRSSVSVVEGKKKDHGGYGRTDDGPLILIAEDHKSQNTGIDQLGDDKDIADIHRPDKESGLYLVFQVAA